ncbi:MAG: sigma-54 dependent transcriptional regulator [Spirochaetes bacterium]|nr:sigma-54 dependent transcriptional regulator [Spirochaetota bacterium]
MHGANITSTVIEKEHVMPQERTGIHRIIGNNKAIASLKSKIKQIAGSKATVMILGESGTGKELIARAIHEESQRKDSQFIPVDCSTLTETIIESELFGHIKGAFTGADKNKKGLFEEAHGGTIFLDEIGNLKPHIQSKLLRFLQEREIKPVGSSKIVKVDVRIISATNINVDEEIAQGNFREDLYYRLSAIELHVPPLRDRRDDIPLLAQHFILKNSYDLNKHIIGISDDALELLSKREWKGNVRELQNVIEHAMIVAENSILTKDTFLQILPEYKESPSHELSPLNLFKAMEEFEKKHILYVLSLAHNNKSKAAKMLGISRSVLYEKLKKYGIH